MVPESFAAFVPLKPEPIYKYSMEGAGKKNNQNKRIYKNVLYKNIIKLNFYLSNLNIYIPAAQDSFNF